MDYSWQNVIDGNGVGITLTGMLIVFSGLALISLFITALPRLLNRSPQPTAASAAASARAVVGSEPTEEEVMAAISLVLHLELEHSLGEDAHLTISRQQRQGSIWASAGKMRSLSEGGFHA